MYTAVYFYCSEKRYVTIKIHQLLHLVECVRHLGPLWAHSCFPFEDLNGRLKKMFHGTRILLIIQVHACTVILHHGWHQNIT